VSLLAAFQVVGSVGAAHQQQGHRSLDALAFGLLLVGPACLLAVARLPLLAVLGPLAAAVTWFSLDYPGGPIPAAFVVGVLVCVVRGQRWQAWSAAGAGGVALWVSYLTASHGLAPVVGGTAWLIVVVTVAEQVRTHRQQRVERRQARVEEQARAASEERLQIARELHDVLAHSVSLISVQAGVGLHLLDSDPEQARTALQTIRDASRDTLTELRATLGALRSDAEDAPLRPAPGLAALDALAAGLARAGVTVRTTVTGEPRALPAGVDLAAYRIVQEALTNVTRHAGTTTAEVHVDYHADAVAVTVLDAGTARGAVTPGNGLTGMRERAVALGGALVAGPRQTGGFSVQARLPT
jgi:signal transduction histidine kinase